MNSLHLSSNLDSIQDFIQNSNSEKTTNTSVAVILLATQESDYNGALYGIHLESNIYQLTRTHFVCLKILDRGSIIGKELSTIKAEIHGRAITVLVVGGHGTPSSIQFSAESNPSDKYLAEEVSAADFQALDANAVIILYACSTGQILAKQIAAVQERRVVAPITALECITAVFFQCCRKCGFTMVGYDANDNTVMNVRIFQRENTVIESFPCVEKAQNAYMDKITWTKKKAEQGNPDAYYQLGGFYLAGIGVKMDLQQAATCYEKAALQNYSKAQRKLGQLYARGDGVEKSLKLATEWYARAAEHGSDEAQYSLGVCYWQGDGVVKDVQQAFNWFRLAAKQNHSAAQNSVGWCYQNGLGRPQSHKRAIKWYAKAALQNFPEAQFRLGTYLLLGEHVKQDPAQAVQWYKKAADQGLPNAQYILGVCYEKGYDVETSKVQLN